MKKFFLGLAAAVFVLFFIFRKSAPDPDPPRYIPMDLPVLGSNQEAAVIAHGGSIFKSAGCLNCHSLKAQKKPFTSSLDHLHEANPGYTYAWLKNPDSMRRGVKMPKPKLTEDEIISLVYLLHQE